MKVPKPVVVSLLDKLLDKEVAEAGVKASKVKQQKVDAERVRDALDEELAKNPAYLDELDEDEYLDLVEALPAKERAKILGDDYGAEIVESQEGMMTSMTPKEAANNLELFTGASEVSQYLNTLDAKGLKEFRENVSEADADLYQSALDRLEAIGPRVAKHEGGSMLVPPEREKYSKGQLVGKVWKALGKEATPEEIEKAEKLIKKPVKNKNYSDRTYVTREEFKLGKKPNREVILKKEYPEGSQEFQNAFLQAWRKKAKVFTHDGKQYKVDEASPEIKNAERESKAVGGEMELPSELTQAPVDTYDNIPESEKETVEMSQLPDKEMEDNYLQFILNESLEEDDQEYLMEVLDQDERLSTIFDQVMDVAGEFSGEGEVNGPGTGVSDSIPARLSDGEFVFTKKATDQLGADKLQVMMDDAERAYDGGLMKKAFGGIAYNPMGNGEMTDRMTEDELTEEEIKRQMISANRMPSVSR